MSAIDGFDPGQIALPLFDTVTIIGVGMMGGSLGLEIRARGLARRVVGVDVDAEALTLAEQRGAIDRGTPDAAQGVMEADCVVFATPVNVIVELMALLASSLRSDALITDLGSTKSRITAAGERLFGPRFVGGHPMCGSPFGGVASAQHSLFDQAPWAIVRSEEIAFQNDSFAQRLSELVLALGSKPVMLKADRHDRIVALVSHLPHILSFTFADLVASDAESESACALAGGSYRDLMRVAHADRELWQAIFRDNRRDLLDSIEAFESQLKRLKSALEVE